MQVWSDGKSLKKKKNTQFCKEPTFYQNQTNSRAKHSNQNENPAQKHKIGPQNLHN